MGFYADISWESRCGIEINVWPHFYKILLVFEVPNQPRVKWMPATLKLTKVGKGCLKFSFCYLQYFLVWDQIRRKIIHIFETKIWATIFDNILLNRSLCIGRAAYSLNNSSAAILWPAHLNLLINVCLKKKVTELAWISWGFKKSQINKIRKQKSFVPKKKFAAC